jgi:hypothetical protein
MHADQNTVNIAYGGKPLFFNSGYKVSMGDKHSIEWYKATQGHNGILINGQGQDQSSAGWGFIERFISGDNVSYALGEAAPAYNHGANAGLVKTFKRHLLMIHSLPIIIIYDELEVAEESTYSWLFHSYKKIAHESDNWISSGSELVKGWVYLDGSLPLEFQITDQFAVEPVNFRRKKGGEDLYPDQWHFKAENKTQAGKMRFLAIIQVATDNIQPKLEIKGKGSIFFKGWQIDAEMDVAQQAKIQIKNTDGLAVFTSTGTLKFNNKAFPSENSSQATLLEILDGSEKVKFSENIIPKSFYEAYYNQKQ